MASVTLTPTTTELTCAYPSQKDAPLFKFHHTVFQGKAPKKYEFVGLANVSVFEISAKANVHFRKASAFTTFGLPAFNELPNGTLFRGEKLDAGIYAGNHVTQEQMSSLIKREGDKTKPLLFPKVNEIEYIVKADGEIGEGDKKLLLEMIQKRMELQFPSIKQQITEQEKKIN